ncbi:MAG: hypothetical protein ACOX0E_02100 [Syntrophomonadaceae bacterium]|jgi:hypothetical protein
MTPLLFITTVTAVLILLVHWILRTLDSPNQANRSENNRHQLYYETSPEISQPVDPIKEANQTFLRLTAHPRHILAYWNIAQDIWHDDKTHNKVIIKLNSSNVKTHPVYFRINDQKGLCRFPALPSTAYYAVLGIDQAGEFKVLATSNTVISTKSENN